MNTGKKAIAALLAVFLLCGCTAVPSREISTPVATTENSEPDALPEIEEQGLPEYEIDKRDTLIKLNAEGGVFEGTVRTDAECDGQGYIILDDGMELTHIADIPSPQHYRVSAAVYSQNGAVLKLSTAEETLGYYYIPAKEEMSFDIYGIDNLYFPAGAAMLKLSCVKGSACIDYIVAENSRAVSQICYQVSSAPVVTESSLAALGLKHYLADCYGRKILTAQNVSPATNAEIDAIYTETGRYPAIRCGELILVTDDDNAEKSAEEIALALDWAKSGGIVSYTWHWYSPNTSKTVYRSDTAFSLDGVFDGADIAGAATADKTALDTLREQGLVSDKLITLINDMDRAAEALKVFRDEDIAVIWQPLPDSDSDLFWWGGNADNSKKLWELMFRRFCDYHKLGNLIWVWNGSTKEFCPDNGMVDIIGQSFSERSTLPFAGRFEALSNIADGYQKPLAITSCERLPKPEYMVRDNAMWLWFAAGSGGAIINSDGSLSERFIDWKSLNLAYNNSVCITRDELPDIKEYSIS